MKNSKTLRLLVSTAMVATAFSPLASTAALADVIPGVTADPLSAANLTAMETTCDNLAASYDNGDGDIWHGYVVLGAVTQTSGPTEVAGTRDIDEGTIVGTGTFVPGTTQIRFGSKNGPFRIGGSVNLFGDQWATAGYYPDSTYNYTADFDSNFSHAYSCRITKEEFHPEMTVHVEAVGQYIVNGDFGSSEDAIRGNCLAFTNQGFPIESRPDWWGVEEYHGGNDTGADGDPNDDFHCRFDGTLEHDETTPEFWDPEADVATVAQTAINQGQTDTLTAFEDHGGRVNVTGDYKIGQVVVCISPSTGGTKGVPGSWKAQNGYSGGNMAELAPAVAGCNTQWFKVAQWGSGSTTSNGTYISVPFYSY
jgi:hypothetical protein